MLGLLCKVMYVYIYIYVCVMLYSRYGKKLQNQIKMPRLAVSNQYYHVSSKLLCVGGTRVGPIELLP